MPVSNHGILMDSAHTVNPPSARYLFAFIDGFAFAQVGTRSRGSAAWKPSQLIPVVAWLNIVAFSLDPHTLELFISDATLFRLPVTHFLSFSFFRMILFISCIQTCNRSIDLDELYKFSIGSDEIGPRLRLQIRQKRRRMVAPPSVNFFQNSSPKSWPWIKQ